MDTTPSTHSSPVCQNPKKQCKKLRSSGSFIHGDNHSFNTNESLEAFWLLHGRDSWTVCCGVDHAILTR